MPDNSSRKVHEFGDICPACGQFTSAYRTICKTTFPCKSHFNLTQMHFKRKCSICGVEWVEMTRNSDWSQALKEVEIYNSGDSLSSKDIEVHGLFAKTLEFFGLDRQYRKAIIRATLIEREACAEIAKLHNNDAIADKIRNRGNGQK